MKDNDININLVKASLQSLDSCLRELHKNHMYATYPSSFAVKIKDMRQQVIQLQDEFRKALTEYGKNGSN